MSDAHKTTPLVSHEGPAGDTQPALCVTGETQRQTTPEPRRAADIASDIQATRAKLTRLEAEMQERAAIEREQWFSMWREMQRRGDV